MAERESTRPGADTRSERQGEGPEEAIAELDRVTRLLRVECPWDREQDAVSIVPHTVEEAYELADAAASGDDAKLADELGDVLFQVHFLALLLEERGSGGLAEVAAGMTEKLIRRHPHVFGEVEADDPSEVLRNWDRIKREREGRGVDDPFADVPENLPGLLYARKLQRRARSAGLDGPAPDAAVALGALTDALGRLRAALAAADGRRASSERPIERERLSEGLGSVLYEIVDLARAIGVDPELALRRVAVERREAARRGGSVADSGDS